MFCFRGTKVLLVITNNDNQVRVTRTFPGFIKVGDYITVMSSQHWSRTGVRSATSVFPFILRHTRGSNFEDFAALLVMDQQGIPIASTNQGMK